LTQLMYNPVNWYPGDLKLMLKHKAEGDIRKLVGHKTI